ncbi:C-type lectin domain containing protein [Trichostrongylus colubriformis]|uniref:C-type lectin domain containing protein n=1 Tax=Trichostrongylus colubriformis TaxID=6319 RepID=A0AAN8FC30_TRICO
MNVNVVCTLFAVIMPIEVFVWAQDPCTPWIYNIESKKCYRKYCDKRKYEDAQKVCQQQGGNLVTICSEAENNFAALMGFVATGYPDQDPEDTWIGLRRNPNNRQQFQWMSGSSCSYTNWYTREPTDWNNVENYVHFWIENGYDVWNDNSPRLFHYICERSTCPQEEVP